MGGEGAILVRDDMKIRSGVFSMPFVDASGGGDAFDAGFIYGLMHGMDPVDCLRVASALGSKLCPLHRDHAGRIHETRM